MIEPTGLSTSFAHSRCRNATAPGPSISIFAKLDSSKMAAACRVASASAPIAGDQCSPAQPRGRVASSAARVDTPAPSSFGVNQFGRSHIDFSPKTAPRAASRLYVGAIRRGRPA